MRNFTTCTKYFKGPFVEILNQLLAKYQQELAKNQPRDLKNHTYILGIPKRKNKGKKAATNHVFVLPTYNHSYNRTDYEVEGRGALAERMIRCSWEIARIANTPDNRGQGQL